MRRFPVVMIAILVLSYALARIPGLIVAALGLFAGYIVTIRFNPRISHRPCRGTGRRTGWIYTWTHHRDRDCGGTGRVIRWGSARFGTQPIRAEATRQEAARRRARGSRAWR